MTKQEQIEILERAILLINTVVRYCGVCKAIGMQLPNADNGFMSYNRTAVYFFLLACKIDLPTGASSWRWPLTPEGDEARRQFLRDHIERLKKELATP